VTIFFAILALLGIGFAIFVLMKSKKLEDDILRVQSEAQASVAEAQRLADQRIAATQQESQVAVSPGRRFACPGLSSVGLSAL